MSQAIELKNVSMQFERQVILERVNMSVPFGNAFGLVGPSGQGKTVLLKLMAGLLDPSTGEVLIEGQAWAARNDSQKADVLKKMGMLFQKNALFDSLTCLENVCFALKETTQKTEAEISEIGAYYLEAVGISHARDLYPDEISGGMQKRLGIARALALEPKIVLYDDPTAGLDPITSKKIIDLIHALKVKNKSTIVVISNDMNRIYQVCDQVGLIYQKELILTGTPEQTKAFEHPVVRQFIRGDLSGPITAEAEG